MPPFKKPFISIHNAAIRINNNLIFENTNWTINLNEHWAIVGKTGSGKTLLAQVLNRNLPLAKGEIIYHFDPQNEPKGRPFLNRYEILTLSPETQRDFLKPFALYHQARWHSFEGEDAPTVSELLSAENIEHHSPFEITPYKIEEKLYRQRREMVIDLFKLDYLLGRRILHLSNGESRKVFIGRLLMMGPRLLILDDPFSGLDQDSRKLLSHGISKLLQEGSPQILFISSDFKEIPPNIDHLLWVEDLKIVEQGKRKHILPGYKDSPLQNNPILRSSDGRLNMQSFNGVVANYSRVFSSNGLHKTLKLIQMNHITVEYGDAPILEDISWIVKAGERWTLRGPNGAGKSTLLSLILADNPKAYANDVIVFGHKRGSGESIWEIKKYVGWVSPELHIFYQKGATCLEVVCSGFFDSIGLYHDCSAVQAKTAQDWMQAFGIEMMGPIPFFTLSAGQQRLVLLARALVKNPPLLILDEPCQGLDDLHTRIFIDLLDQLCRNTPITLIYVTHYQGEIPSSMTHQLVLEHGRVVNYGPL